MFWNYIKLAQRNIIKRKVFSLINIIGLSVGIAASILILLYVLHELSYDNYHTNVHNKYRVISHFDFGDEEFDDYVSNGMLTYDMKENIPGVKNAFQVYVEFPYVQYNDKTFLEDNDDVYYVGEGIIDFFSIEFVSGDPNIALKNPFSAVITESCAKRYFGNESALGKSFLVNSKFPFIITGIVRDQSNKTHFKFNILFSLTSFLQTNGIKDLYSLQNSFINYVELDDGRNVELIENEVSQISDSYLPAQVKEQGVSISNFLQPIKEIHLKSTFYDVFKGGDIKTVYIFSSIAILILILASINFINLSTAQYSRRTTEVAIRKTCGASKNNLIKQFITESFIITLISLTTAIVIAELFLPGFNKVIGFDLEITYFKNWYDILLIVGVGILVGTVSSLYPAFFLSSFRVVDIFKMKIGVGHGSINIRRVLVVFQFAVTIFLIISSLVIYKQLKFVSNKDLGFDKNNLIAIRLNNKQVVSQIDIFKSEIDQFSFVESSSVCSNYPSGEATWENVFEFEGHANEQFPSMPVIDVDYNFLETMKISLKEGRNFSKEFTTDSMAVLVNESLVKQLGWKNPINKQITEQIENNICKYHVIGVINDYHKESFHSSIKPMIIRLAKRKSFLMVRLNGGYDELSIQMIKKLWTKFLPDKPFQNKFIDEEFDNLYKSERNLSSILIYFSVIAIMIACLGLLGLIIFFAQQKTKEISIRKILGAHTKNITFSLTRELILLQLISNLIAIPLSYFAMNKWIQEFIYHTSINWWIYLVGTIITAVISIITISMQTYKAASANPAENLRYE
jgi:putative ABC transport system permease protein